MWFKKLKVKCKCNMKTLTDIRNEITAIQAQLAQTQNDIQAIIDSTPSTPDIPQITIPLNTPIELVTG